MPLTPLGAPPPEPRYSFALRARHKPRAYSLNLKLDPEGGSAAHELLWQIQRRRVLRSDRRYCDSRDVKDSTYNN